jgi:tetratricopeptide (TPR) repeat protein
MTPARLMIVLAGALSVTVLGGCSATRPLNVVRDTGDTNYRIERWEEARANYQEFIDRKPSEPEVRYRLGMSLVELGRPADAREHLRIACDVMPNEDRYIEGYAEALLQSNERDQLLNFLRNKTNDRGKVTDFMRLGRFAAKAGNADEALAALKTAARIDGGRTYQPQLALADFYGSIGDTGQQLERVRMAYFIAPGNPQVLSAIQALGQVAEPRFARVPDEARVDGGVGVPRDQQPLSPGAEK